MYTTTGSKKKNRFVYREQLNKVIYGRVCIHVIYMFQIYRNCAQHTALSLSLWLLKRSLCKILSAPKTIRYHAKTVEYYIETTLCLRTIESR
jgi:hypothetical protein